MTGLDFEAQLEEQLKTIQPFYKLLHAYVRKKLRERYGADRILEDGPIPAHILGKIFWFAYDCQGKFHFLNHINL